ncbi:heparan sulfate 2-O-sulfotransferase 1-like [Amphibalanus amphitrite]|uniref:heparan sulfate 2-O-sulfotransferase 1-like n=1 Tax=Amphibalanus amphitrite TaxID=1232801 RepID=UPI001C900647|nr:heparan sulfate 2-O-sulfotransferase 1-like [Amphibalanus amphitrite]
MAAVGPRFFALLLVASVFVFYLTVINYENRLSALQSRLTYIERRLSTPDADAAETVGDETVVIYNRVPKTGSTTFMGICYDICEKQGFNVIHLNTSKNAHVMSSVDQMEFVTNITTWKQRLPALYHGHIAFIDFAAFGVQRRPIYVNLIRRPLDRLVSHYYFLRYGDDFRPHLVRTRAGDTETFDDCVRLNHSDCQPRLMWIQVPFFCGMAAFCWEPGSRQALEAAKHNLVHHYLLVGTTERLPEFVALLEALMPSMFSGASRALEKGGKSHLRKTQRKLEPSPETKATIQASAVWKVESEFYGFAEQQFNFVKQKTMVAAPGGRLRPRPRAYHYEKIRPNKPK